MNETSAHLIFTWFPASVIHGNHVDFVEEVEGQLCDICRLRIPTRQSAQRHFALVSFDHIGRLWWSLVLIFSRLFLRSHSKSINLCLMFSTKTLKIRRNLYKSTKNLTNQPKTFTDPHKLLQIRLNRADSHSIYRSEKKKETLTLTKSLNPHPNCSKML